MDGPSIDADAWTPNTIEQWVADARLLAWRRRLLGFYQVSIIEIGVWWELDGKAIRISVCRRRFGVSKDTASGSLCCHAHMSSRKLGCVMHNLRNAHDNFSEGAVWNGEGGWRRTVKVSLRSEIYVVRSKRLSVQDIVPRPTCHSRVRRSQATI